ncbi:hypothetical protein SLS60_002664 [Paraconiothyrium brasiliense]|uniref:Peripheral subunit-binding (PSBD) domain-containing protein n=1 Tax=Paraconiothyrium brasiliense TaxID=300254 RepID=A0ABR3RTY9_9PLEO
MKAAMSREAARFLCRSALVGRTPIAPRTEACTLNVQRRRWDQRRGFVATNRLKVVKPYILADIGEGITECQITSRFDGVIKKLYYEPDDMAKVGKAHIDIQSEISEADAAVLDGAADKPTEDTPKKSEPRQQEIEVDRNDTAAATGDVPVQSAPPLPAEPAQEESEPRKPPGKHASLATPAVRHMVKAANLNIEDIEGTGKDGRVLKEDVQRHTQSAKARTTSVPSAAAAQQLEDRTQPLTPIQTAMFKKMAQSLSVPHFLYTDGVDFTALNAIRKKYNASREKSQRLTTFPFIVKALSLALQQYPLLNAHLDTQTNPDKPQLIYKGAHNIGIAVDSPTGLLVPVIRNVQSLSIEEIAAEIARLSVLARDGKLSTNDMKNATITISNIGSIGGGVVAPVISTPQVAIVGIGRAKTVPAFGKDGELIKKEECTFSWSADHRVIDGATAARCAEVMRGYLEDVESMLVSLR